MRIGRHGGGVGGASTMPSSSPSLTVVVAALLVLIVACGPSSAFAHGDADGHALEPVPLYTIDTRKHARALQESACASSLESFGDAMVECNSVVLDESAFGAPLLSFESESEEDVEGEVKDTMAYRGSTGPRARSRRRRRNVHVFQRSREMGPSELVYESRNHSAVKAVMIKTSRGVTANIPLASGESGFLHISPCGKGCHTVTKVSNLALSSQDVSSNGDTARFAAEDQASVWHNEDNGTPAPPRSGEDSIPGNGNQEPGMGDDAGGDPQCSSGVPSDSFDYCCPKNQCSSCSTDPSCSGPCCANQISADRPCATFTAPCIMTVVQTVSVFYTDDVQRSVYDVAGLVRLAIAETNAGYMASKVPVRLSLAMLAKTSIPDNADSYNLLMAFRGTDRGSGNVAVLLSQKLTSCGRAFLDCSRYSSNDCAYAVVRASCATGYYSFGHEIGHIQGLDHNAKFSSDPYSRFADNHGHVMSEGFGEDGHYRTIMAYAVIDETRIVMFSNPSIQVEGKPAGVVGESNNARVLRATRYSVARMNNPSAPYVTTLPPGSETTITLSPTAPTASPTQPITKSPTPRPTPRPTLQPTLRPTNAPTTRRPTAEPTSKAPTPAPTTSHPTARPTSAPTLDPTRPPTTKQPTSQPTRATPAPTLPPTSQPTTLRPTTLAPTSRPTTASPTQLPTRGPTLPPNDVPSKAPTNEPTTRPTLQPTSPPSRTPTKLPTAAPSRTPTAKPTTRPTPMPTFAPSGTPTSSRPSRAPSTARPSQAPSTPKPTPAPTLRPTTVSPTKQPTNEPTVNPSGSPTTRAPSQGPTTPVPTEKPTTQSPTLEPSRSPSTRYPSRAPVTHRPTASPTNAPSTSPTEPTPAPVFTRFPTVAAPTRPDVMDIRSRPTVAPVEGGGLGDDDDAMDGTDAPTLTVLKTSEQSKETHIATTIVAAGVPFFLVSSALAMAIIARRKRTTRSSHADALRRRLETELGSRNYGGRTPHPVFGLSWRDPNDFDQENPMYEHHSVDMDEEGNPTFDINLVQNASVQTAEASPNRADKILTRRGSRFARPFVSSPLGRGGEQAAPPVPPSRPPSAAAMTVYQPASEEGYNNVSESPNGAPMSSPPSPPGAAWQ